MMKLTTYNERRGATAALLAAWTLLQQVREPVEHCWAKTGVAAAKRAVTMTLKNILMS